MKTRLLLMAGTAGLLFTACAPSVNPFYTAQDVTFDPQLVGLWRVTDEGDEPERWEFRREDKDQVYRLTVTDDEGRQGEFKAVLFELREHRFLDLIPTRCKYATNQAELVAIAMFPGHLVVRVAQIEPSLKLAFMDGEWLDDHLKENPRSIEHRSEEPDGRVVLTASTRDLQRFLLKHVEGGDLFSDYGELKREAVDKEKPGKP